MFANERKEFRKIKKQSLDIIRSENQILFSKNILNITSYIFMGIFSFGMIAITFISYMNNKATLGDILFVSQYALIIVFWINYAIRISFEIISDISTINNSIRTLMVEPKIKNKVNSDKIEVKMGKIIFKNIEFGYKKENYAE